jgi:hypothetical protein
MKKNTLLYLIIFIALGVTAAVLVLKHRQSTLPQALTDFGYDDTASVTKIILQDHYKNTIVLERKGKGDWTVNEKYKANQVNIDMILETIKEVRVKNPIPIPAKNNVIKDLATNGIKIDIYSGSKESKSYYVGSPTPDDLGTLMLLQGSSQPFITWIPGFNGYLTPRYMVRLKDWRSPEIYHLNPADITGVTVKYFSNPSQSFTLKVDNNRFLLSRPNDNIKPAASVNPLLAKKYLSGYRDINFEVIANLTPHMIDSILKKTPYAEVDLSCGDKIYPPMILYPKYADISTKSIGKDNTDLDRFYGIIGKDSKELLLIQTYMVGKLLAVYNDLASGKGDLMGGRP